MLLDGFLRLCEGLYGPGYKYTGRRNGESYEYCQQYGGDCSGMLDVCCREMGITDPGGTGSIS